MQTPLGTFRIARPARWAAAILAVGLLWQAWQLGYFGTSLPVTVIAQDFMLGRPITRYTPLTPSVWLVTSVHDADALLRTLAVSSATDLQPPIATTLRRLDYTNVIAVLALHGVDGPASIAITSARLQGERLVLEARLRQPGWGEGAPPVESDAYQLITIPKIDLPDGVLRIELWDGWRQVAITSGRVDVATRSPARATDTPGPAAPAVTPPVPVPTYPAPVYPAPVYPAPKALQLRPNPALQLTASRARSGLF